MCTFVGNASRTRCHEIITAKATGMKEGKIYFHMYNKSFVFGLSFVSDIVLWTCLGPLGASHSVHISSYARRHIEPLESNAD